MSKPTHIQTPSKITSLLLNEVKKALYKEKPIAIVTKKGCYYFTYTCTCSLGDIIFKVPLDEMGENIFENQISAQLLIRWIKL